MADKSCLTLLQILHLDLIVSKKLLTGEKNNIGVT